MSSEDEYGEFSDCEDIVGSPPLIPAPSSSHSVTATSDGVHANMSASDVASFLKRAGIPLQFCRVFFGKLHVYIYIITTDNNCDGSFE